MTRVRDERCPLCAIKGIPLIALEFAHKAPLSDSIEFRWCEACDFIYAQDLNGESYSRFYESAMHDTGHIQETGAQDDLRRIQALLIQRHVGPAFSGNCLDYGCGEGQLLEHLHRTFRAARFFGTDVRNSLRPNTPATFLADLAPAGMQFDLVVLSHVAEHVVDLSVLLHVVKWLAPGGAIYIEVPDPVSYRDLPRREFMYYFDRLHVNHFSQTALTQWLANYGLEVTGRGAHRFAYRDGKYPAQYVFAAASTVRSQGGRSAPSLREAFQDYRDSELRRAKQLRDRIMTAVGGREILVYGRGDNFFRARSSGGPLHGIPIRAVLDRNAQSLQSDGKFYLLEPQAGLRRFPDAALLVAVSSGAEQIVDDVRAQFPKRITIIV